MKNEPNPKRMLRASHLTERYRVTPRTIDRWKNTQVLPPPDLTINKINYWFEETIERNEQENLSARKRKPTEADTESNAA